MNLEANVALAVLCLSLWSALALLADRQGPRPLNRRFALVIGLFCIPQAYFFSWLQGSDTVSAVLGIAAQAAIWLKGPMLLSVVRLAIGRPLRREWRHWLAFPAAFAAMMLGPGGPLAWGTAGMCALAAYLLAALVDLLRARARLRLIHSAFPNSAWHWLLFVAGGLLALVSVDLGVMVSALWQGAFPVDFIKLTNWMVASYFIVIAFCSIYRPRLFPREEPGIATSVPAAPIVMREWRELDASIASALGERLNELMQGEQLYRQHDLSLSGLAARLGVSTHQASELLNVHLRRSFYDYLNEHRLRHAERLLEDSDGELRVLDIAFDAGFGNKNSFYRSFRERHGMTPVQFREQHRASGGDGMAAAAVTVQSQNPS